MSREIKFRAWVDGKMITPAVWINEENLPSYSLGSAPKYPLMQYTGLKDRSGVEIYEGDILLCDGEPMGFIVFENGAFRVDDKTSNQGIAVINQERASRLIVGGNIHQNPELLESQK